MNAETQAYLLDSHVLLWWWFEPERLSKPVSALLCNPATPIWVSAATVWELSLKHHLGKLPELNGTINDLRNLLQADGFNELMISAAHGLRAGSYQRPHRDPFDRMLAAQAELNQVVLLSADRQLSGFPCQVLW